MIEAALAIDPHHQKGLWLLGVAAAQNGDNALALATLQKLLDQLDPASGAATSVSQQIETLKMRMGEAGTEPAVTGPAITGASR